MKNLVCVHARVCVCVRERERERERETTTTNRNNRLNNVSIAQDVTTCANQSSVDAFLYASR